MSNTSDSTPPQVEYDRGLIADMLDALITFGDKLAGFTYRSINDQIALLRAADDRDAAGVHTAKQEPPVVDEVVAWAVDRDGDRTFPRIYATEAEADHMVFNVTVNPPAKKRPVIGYEAVKAALTAALKPF